MRQPALGFDTQLLTDHTPPCVSLYQPTHRAQPGQQGDAIQFKNLVRRAEDSLRQQYSHRDAAPILDDLHGLAGDDTFWREHQDALGVFCSPNLFRVVRLNRPVRDHVVVSETFHTKPLVRSVHFSDRYHVLNLTSQEVSFSEGDQYSLAATPLWNMPQTLREALGLSAAPATVDDATLKRFYQLVDRNVWDHYSRPSLLPLVLAGTAHHQSLFRKISINHNLLPEGIETNPQGYTPHRLHEEAWKRVEKIYQQRLERAVDQFRLAKSRNLGSSDLNAIGEAAVGGRVQLLLVDADRQVGGKLDPISGHVQPVAVHQPAFNDVLDDITDAVLRRDGEVCVVPSAQMPSDSGAAAIYRY